MTDTTSPAPVPSHRTPTHYVGIGASAGGLEAIENLFSAFPADTGMAFIVIQHLSPDHKSLMVELLSKRTAMTVRRAENNLLIEANTVYLIPPKRNLTIFHGSLLLQEQRSGHGVNLPIDIFLRSLADDQEDRAVGIILSGTGSDGMHGIRAIKEAGGLVVVQAPESAKFDGMPNSAISTGIADFVLPPSEIPTTLVKYSKHPYTTRRQPPPVATDEDGWLPRILALLRQKKKLDFTYYKPTTIIRRMQRRMTINQIDDPDDYARFLENVPREIDDLYRDLLIGVTNFFRDAEAYAALRSRYLPALLTEDPGREFRFWVAGCSTGEEAYTLAILVREIERETGRSLRVKIFATDVDGEALYTAANGLFPESCAADLTADLLERYFHRSGDGFRVNRRLREMVVFARHNLIKDPPFTKIDLVSCRNLLIYLQPVLQRKVLEKFNFSLREGGLLMLGNSETIGDLDSHLETLDPKARLYRSRGRTLAITPRVELPTFDSARRNFDRDAWRRDLDRNEARPRLIEKVLEEAARDYLPPTLVVNGQNEVLHALGDSGELFRLPAGKITNDAVKMAHADLAIPLSTALQRVHQTHREVVYENLRLRFGDEIRVYVLRVKPLHSARSLEQLVAVFMEPSVVPAADGRSEAVPYDVDRATQQRLLDLEQELQFSRENLQATIEELETSNEELQATNEELMASNEELQSTNEELQSVNEELFTVNAEHQKKIAELTEMTNDLDNLLVATQIGTLFLDENLDIRRFTPGVTTVLNLRDGDIGRPVTEVTHRLLALDLVAAIIEVKRSDLPQRVEARNVDGAWYLVQILPYRISSTEVSGVVVTFVDITRLKLAETALEDTDGSYRLLLASIPSGVALFEKVDAGAGRRPLDFTVTDINPALERITGLSRSALVGERLSQVPVGRGCSPLVWQEALAAAATTGEPVHHNCSCDTRGRGCHVFAYTIDERRLAAVIAAGAVNEAAAAAGEGDAVNGDPS